MAKRGKRGMGSVYRQKGRKIWYLKYYRDGKPYRESSGSEKKEVAIVKLRQRLGEIDKGLPITPDVHKIRFSDLAEAEVRDYKFNNRRSLRDLLMRLRRHILPYFGHLRAVNITAADISAFVEKRKSDNASNGEINRELTVMRRAFNLALEQNLLFNKPPITMLEEDNVRKGFFEEAEFRTLCKFLPEEIRPLVTFAYITGWRIPSEVQTLEWRNVDFQARMVRLDPGVAKNKEGRLFPFTAELREILEGQRKKTNEIEKFTSAIIPWVFHREGKKIKHFRRSWLTACRKAGLAGRIGHDFRRTAVRNLVRAGVHSAVAKKLTGHKTDSVFERYNIVTESDLKEAAVKLERLGPAMQLRKKN